MTRKHFADLVDRSVSWVEKVEAGDRRLVRLPMIQKVAEALQVDWRILVDESEAEEATRLPDAAEIQAIKTALARYEMQSQPSGLDGAPDLGSLAQHVEYVQEAFLASDFAVVGTALPKLIRDCQHAVRLHRGADRCEAASLLVMVYKVTSSTLHKFGSHELAWLAADRAVLTADIAGDPVSLARAARCAGRALMSNGLPGEALDLIKRTTARLESTVATASRELLCLVGMMCLAGEIAAAREGDADTAKTMHDKADAVADRLGVDFNDRTTAFGKANVALHRVSSLVRLGDGRAALVLAESLNTAALARLPRERRVNHLLDVAQAHRQCGDAGRAVAALREADATAPQEIRRRPVARDLIAELSATTTDPEVSSRLRQLAANAGLSL
nr:helix-turn-helix transcriptional regulator [Actinomadura rugatobispora]